MSAGLPAVQAAARARALDPVQHSPQLLLKGLRSTAWWFEPLPRLYRTHNSKKKAAMPGAAS
jgi:hypothetical protein